MINLPLILQLRNLHTINATPILFHTEMIKSISLISLGQHLLHCKHIPTSCSQNFFTKKLQLFMSWSIFLFVSSLKINETIHSIRIKQWVQQKQNITHRYGSTKRSNVVKKIWNYMITFQSLIGTVQQQCLLRFMFSLYLISTVFQSFSPKKSVNLFIVNSRKALILLAFLFLSKLARRFTDFSAVFLLFSALFHAVFVLEALILLPWRFTDFFTDF
mgnify:CR=1 FL=1